DRAERPPARSLAGRLPVARRLVVRVGGAVDLGGCGSVADVGAGPTAPRPGRLGATGGPHKPTDEQEDGQDATAAVHLQIPLGTWTASDERTTTARRMKPPTSTSSEATGTLRPPSRWRWWSSNGSRMPASTTPTASSSPQTFNQAVATAPSETTTATSA